MFEIIITLLLLMPGYDFQTKEMEPENVISQANNEFSFKIFKMLSKDENDVMSSLSILSALGILMNGANGQTLEDMKRFLEFNNSSLKSNEQPINEGFKIICEKYQNAEAQDNKNVGIVDLTQELKHQLNLVNRVVHKQQIELLPDFVNNVKQYFKAEVQSADFKNNTIEETNKINEWVRNQTNNKIQKIFDKLEKETIAVIVNVLYFKGNWYKTFNSYQTMKVDFYNNGEDVIQTDMMSKQERFKYSESEELNSQFLQMDYMGGNISFVVVLPKEKNGLTSLKDKINAQNFERALKLMETKNVNVYLPKFKVERSYDLMDKINPKPIALTSSADLSRMTSEPIIVDQIKHKVFIDLNEKGTEAAAVTAISAVAASAWIPHQTVLFRADHPFLYFIRDKTNSMILFSGQINKFKLKNRSSSGRLL